MQTTTAQLVSGRMTAAYTGDPGRQFTAFRALRESENGGRRNGQTVSTNGRCTGKSRRLNVRCVATSSTPSTEERDTEFVYIVATPQEVATSYQPRGGILPNSSATF